MSKLPSKISILLITALIPAIAFAGIAQNRAAFSQFDYEKYLIVPENNQQDIKKVDNGNAKKKPAGSLMVTQRVAEFITHSGGGSDPVVSTAFCNDDEVVTGGGFEFNIAIGTNGAERAVIEKAAGNGWSVTVISDGTFRAIAECAKIAP